MSCDLFPVGRTRIRLISFSASVLLLVLGLIPTRADSTELTVHVTTRAPIQSLDASGHPSGVAMAVPGTTFTFVKQEGDRLEIRSSEGSEYSIAISATDYVLPTEKTDAAVVTNTSSPVPPTSANVAAPAAVETPAASNPGNDDAEMIRKLNEAFGLSLLVDDHFWDDAADSVADRLKWPKESQTMTDSSYRRYSKA